MEVLLDVYKAKIGDKEAFTRLIHKYKKTMYIIARSRLSKKEDVEDAMQETIIDIYTGITKLKEPRKFVSWMTTILINNCNKVYKKSNKNTMSYDELEENNSNIKDESYFENIENELNFMDIISFLNIEDKTIISMFYLEDYTTREISEILNINESTLRSRISSIRSKIKERLGKEKKGDR